MPAVLPATISVKLQDAVEARVASDSRMLLDPEVAVMIPAPQSPVRPTGVDTTRPEGNVSVKPIPLKEVPVFGFTRLNVKATVPFSATVCAANDFEMIGGAIGVAVKLEELAGDTGAPFISCAVIFAAWTFGAL